MINFNYNTSINRKINGNQDTRNHENTVLT